MNFNGSTNGIKSQIVDPIQNLPTKKHNLKDNQRVSVQWEPDDNYTGSWMLSTWKT